MRRAVTLLLVFLLPARMITAVGSSDEFSDNGALIVFTASSLGDVVSRFAELFETETGRPVSINSASSSVLARQIAAGAEADVFFTADQKWSVFLEEEGIIVPAGSGETARGTRHQLCGNSMVVIAPPGSSGGPPLDQSELIALGDPSHVPAGRYAVQALRYLGLYTELKSRIIPCSDVRAALRTVAAGESDRGIVYATDVRDSDVRVVSTLPEESHQAIIYEVVLLPTAESLSMESDSDGSAFVDMVLGDRGWEILDSFGFRPAVEEG